MQKKLALLLLAVSLGACKQGSLSTPSDDPIPPKGYWERVSEFVKNHCYAAACTVYAKVFRRANPETGDTEPAVRLRTLTSEDRERILQLTGEPPQPDQLVLHDGKISEPSDYFLGVSPESLSQDSSVGTSTDSPADKEVKSEVKPKRPQRNKGNKGNKSQQAIAKALDQKKTVIQRIPIDLRTFEGLGVVTAGSTYEIEGVPYRVSIVTSRTNATHKNKPSHTISFYHQLDVTDVSSPSGVSYIKPNERQLHPHISLSDTNVRRGEFHITTPNKSKFYYNLRGVLVKTVSSSGRVTSPPLSPPREVEGLKRQVLRRFQICSQEP